MRCTGARRRLGGLPLANAMFQSMAELEGGINGSSGPSSTVLQAPC